VASTRDRDAWERVLAAVEADALRAEALLRAPGASFEPSLPLPPDMDEGGRDHADPVPADWKLPSAVELPPLESMPPVPEELSERILALRSQIIELQAQLSAAMQAIPRPHPRHTVAVVSAEAPAFIDRRL
jgi:hypothetical protein